MGGNGLRPEVPKREWGLRWGGEPPPIGNRPPYRRSAKAKGIAAMQLITLVQFKCLYINKSQPVFTMSSLSATLLKTSFWQKKFWKSLKLVKEDLAGLRHVSDPFATDLSVNLNCRRPAENMLETWFHAGSTQVSDKTDVMEFGLLC